MLVDPRQNRLAEIDGRLVTEVKFWGGLLGHLDKGGTFTVKQEDVGGGHWQMVELNVQMSGRALLFQDNRRPRKAEELRLPTPSRSHHD